MIKLANNFCGKISNFVSKGFSVLIKDIALHVNINNINHYSNKICYINYRIWPIFYLLLICVPLFIASFDFWASYSYISFLHIFT